MAVAAASMKMITSSSKYVFEQEQGILELKVKYRSGEVRRFRYIFMVCLARSVP